MVEPTSDVALSVADLVLETVPLGFQWPTVDPFLFCVHHLDTYPAADGRLGPAASLAGRDLGSDFSGIDGWRMYHGQHVPGFPSHPHRGFETVTFVRQGLIDHADSLGAAARFGRGDTQWVTAGSGIVHSEMFPLLDDDGPNPVELFQIWLNLPADSKMADPHFTMLWDGDVPHLEHVDDAGRRASITVIAGALGDARPVPPPPDSYASRPESDLAIWHARLDPHATWTAPPAAGEGTVRMLYLYEGDGLEVGGTALDGSTGAAVRADAAAELRAGADGASILVLQGRPIGEPVAQHGPFVMNDREGLVQAFEDYRRTGFGSWPWDVDDPNHGPDRGRFARYADGRIEEISR
jgi:redox-sensitive bicupin YhaK (pirin superfamily)